MRHSLRNTSCRRPHNPLVLETLEPRVLLAADLQNLTYQPVQILNPYSDQAVTVEQMMARAAEVPFVEGDLMVALEIPSESNAVKTEFYLESLRWSDLTGVPTAHVSTLMQMDQPAGHSFVLVQLNVGQADLFQTMTTMDEMSLVLWTSPNFYLEGDQQDFIPNDPGYGQQYTHPLVGSELAWETTLGSSSIVVGITDDGVDLAHPDLSPNIWVNPGEVAGNGIDDDNNGYVDDIHGWDWANDNNDPAPNGGSHGTHVAGISAARTDNGIGVAGLSGQSTIMPLQFYGGANGWTASIINNTFTYAADNGAHIVNTSYNINGWVGDPVFTAGLQYMYDNGVLHFNSAGNGSELNPARQAFEQTFLVVSTTSSDTKSGFSNYGTGVDISAPGSDVYSTLPGGAYGNNSGTSMAAPNAAGAAALIWSANPSWTRDQVVAQLLGTADNIDAQNPAYAGLMGAGRINVARAISETLAAPQIRGLTNIPEDGGVTNDLTIDSLEFSFNQVMDPTSVNDLSHYGLRNAGVDGLFGTADDSTYGLSLTSAYQLSTNQLTLQVDGGPLPFGDYQFGILSDVVNPFGTPLDGNGDGVGGDSFISHFTIAPPPPVGIAPSGSLIYSQSFSGSILSAAEADQFGIDLDAGQSLTVIVQGDSGLVPNITIVSPTGDTLQDVTGVGSVAVTTVVPTASAGRYTLEVGGDADSTGSYELQWLLNANRELEDIGIGSNDSLGEAQELDSSAVMLGSGLADRLALVGALPGDNGTPIVQDGFESGGLSAAWTTQSTNTGRIQVTGQYGTAAGNFALIMDSNTDSSYSRNEAIWTVDLASLNQPKLIFDHANFNDEGDALPISFTGSIDGDGVSISDDGVNWYRVFDPSTSSSGSWENVVVDLTDAASAAGMVLSDGFQIKFQQYDNFSLDTDGRGFDNISINQPDLAADWYAFDLQDGQWATLAATRYQGGGQLTVDLFDSSGTLIQSGMAGDNVSSYISQFQDGTNNGTVDTWYARVSGQDSAYSLLVTRDADFDLEPNDAATPQPLNEMQGVLGFVSTFFEQVAEPDDFAAGTVLNNAIPGAVLSNPVGGSDVIAESASFGARTGSLVFAPGIGNASGWSDGDDELRVDFATPTSFVSIDVGSDDSSDVAFLRAYDNSGNLLEEVISGSVSQGGSQSISINRSSAEISYVVAAGLGSDITPLDNLVFGSPGSADAYLIDGVAGQEIRLDAFLPGEGPNWFINGLATPAGSDLRMELYEDFGGGALVATGIESIAYTPTQAGTYRLVVTSDGGAGEYYLQRGEGPTNRYDFGPVGSAIQAEWTGVATQQYNPATGYGWLGRYRGLELLDLAGNDPLNGDGVQVALGTFVADVPNGDYLVKLHFGNAVHDNPVSIAVEGGFYSFTPTTNQVEVFKTSVQDGQMTLEFGGGTTAIRTKWIRFAGIEIVERDSNFARNDTATDSDKLRQVGPTAWSNPDLANRPQLDSQVVVDILNARLDSEPASLESHALQDMAQEWDLTTDTNGWQRDQHVLLMESPRESSLLGLWIDEILDDPFAF